MSWEQMTQEKQDLHTPKSNEHLTPLSWELNLATGWDENASLAECKYDDS